MKDLAQILALVREFVEAVPASVDGEERGVMWFDSFRGAYCPTCTPIWTRDAAGYQHDVDCPFGRLLEEFAE